MSLSLCVSVLAFAETPSEPESAPDILAMIARLRAVTFDVTRLARLSITDTGLAKRMTNELPAHWPTAQQDASNLVEWICRAKPAEVGALIERQLKVMPRSPYLDFTLLTALNTRGRDIPDAALADLSHSEDFIVRQTACLMRARLGEPRGLQILFSELNQTDAAGCVLLHSAFEELLGAAVPAPPPAGSKEIDQTLAAWKSKVLAWWHENQSRLKHVPHPKEGEPYWKAAP